MTRPALDFFLVGGALGYVPGAGAYAEGAGPYGWGGCAAFDQVFPACPGTYGWGPLGAAPYAAGAEPYGCDDPYGWVCGDPYGWVADGAGGGVENDDGGVGEPYDDGAPAPYAGDVGTAPYTGVPDADGAEEALYGDGLGWAGSGYA